MWSLVAFCLACLVFTSNGSSEQPGNWMLWLLQDTDSASSSSNSRGSRSSSSTSWKRTGPSLSIVNPLDVLRQRLQLETARRRQFENEQRIRENELLLRNLGKRRST